MTTHLPHPSPSMPSAITASSPLQSDIAARAGRIALRIAETAAHHTRLTALAADLARGLRGELGAHTVALYRCRHEKRRRGGTSSTLHAVAVDCQVTELAEHAGRRLKLSAYRALNRSTTVVRSASHADDETPASPSLIIALPLGTSTIWSVVVFEWSSPTDRQRADYRALVEALRPAISIAARPAHALDEAAQSDHPQAPRRTVFAVTSEAIASLDDTFIIREINPAFTKILGWTESSAVGHRCSEILRCRDDHRMLLCDTPRCPLREAFDTSAASPVRDLSWDTQSGKPCEVSASFTAQHSEQHADAVIVARDVTLLNAANRMRANFISMVSHELRTPLNSINGFLEIILESPVGPLNERQREFLNYARISTQQLTTLVEDILFISKADSGQFTLRLGRVRMAKVVDQARQIMQPAAEKAQVELIAEVQQGVPVVRADELRIQQVLTNLLGNAIKFSPSGSSVRLAVTHDDMNLLCAVSDQGRGIAPEEHARIFERFYQSDSTVRNRAGGYGLGLSIARLIVEQHHGRIWVESEAGQGATFYFTLPLHTS